MNLTSPSFTPKANAVKWFNSILLALLPLAMVFFFACSSKQEAPAPTTPTASVVELKAATTSTFQEYPASIEGKSNLEIRPQIDGYLKQVFVDEGSYVSAGQPLFKIDEQPFREQWNSAIANLQAAEAAATNAQLEIEKLTPLVQNKVVSEYQLKAAQANYRAAQAHIALSKSAVGSAQINLGYTLIKAPVSGYIGRLPKKQGSLVSRSDPQALTSLSDIHEIHVYFSLAESDFIVFKAQYEGNTLEDKIKKVPGISLVLADNTVFPEAGKIDMVDGQFDRTTGAITLRASFPNAQGLLRSGNTGKIRLGLVHPDAIVIPQSATVEVQDKVYVYTLGDSNKISKQPINIVGRTGSDYLVNKGVKAGDRIVTEGLDHLQEGMVVKPEPVVVASRVE